MRYVLAQATVAGFFWVVCAAAQLAATMLLARIPVEAAYAQYLLAYRPMWVIGICLLGSFAMVLLLSHCMLLPNAGGALSVYLILAPVLLIVQPMLPQVLSWDQPVSADAGSGR